MRIPAIATISLALTTGLLACGSDDDAGEQLTFEEDRTLVIAHRGGNRLAPEHTLLNFDRAEEQGVDVFEMDFRVTSDGVLVLMHDQTVDRTTDGEGRVEEFTFEEIRQLDAGYTYTQDGGETYPYRGMGLQVPTVEEMFQRYPGKLMNIEIKAENPPSVIPTFIELLDRYDMRDRVLIPSFSAELVEQFREAAPDVRTSYTIDEVVEFFVLSEENEETYVPPARFLQVPPTFQGIEVLTQEFVDKAHRLDLFVHAWGADNRMEEMVALGLDGLITDDTERLMGLLE